MAGTERNITPMIQETIERFLTKHGIPRNAGFILAVSGGADSISLLHAFCQLNLRIWVLHCNFSLRGKESDTDEQFVKRFCESYGIGYSVKKFNTLAYAREKSLSIEMAARELRYSWFREMKKKKKMDYIVVAHHADDVAETLLINLCRGTGIKGLTGIKPVNGDILRPLLECPRTDILRYIEAHQLSFRTDSTNNSLDYLRNKIRHQVIPVLKEINPSFSETITENCTALRETEQIFNYGIHRLQEEILERKEGEILISIARTLSSPAPYTFLYETLRPFGFNKARIRDILNTCSSIPGKQFTAGRYTLVKDRTCWRLYETRPEPCPPLLIPDCGQYTMDNQILEISQYPRTEDFNISKDPAMVCLDADKVEFPLCVRHWQAGDYFCPLGMQQRKKKLSDFFAGQKFSAKQKNECLLLLSGDQVAWIVGYRPDDRFKITSSTQRIIQIRQLHQAPRQSSDLRFADE